jgi:hypothetical protein
MVQINSLNNQKSPPPLCNMLFMCFSYDVYNVCYISISYVDLVGMNEFEVCIYIYIFVQNLNSIQIIFHFHFYFLTTNLLQ